MDYSKIQELLNDIKDNSQYELSRDNFCNLDLVEILLEGSIGNKKVLLTDLRVTPESGILEGDASDITLLGTHYSQIRLKYTFSEIYNKIQLRMEFSWDNNIPYPLGKLTELFTFTDLMCGCIASEGLDVVIWDHTGHILLSGDSIAVGVSCVQDSDNMVLKTIEDEAERKDTDLSDIFELFGVEGAGNLLPKNLTDILGMVALHDFTFACDCKRNRIMNTSVNLAVKNVEWKPTGSFAAVLSGLQLEAYPDAGEQPKLQWSAKVSGTVCLGDTLIPVHVGYISQGNQIWAGIGGQEPILLGGISDLSRLVETGSIDTGVLPFQSASFYLNDLYIDYSVDDNKISEFHLTLSVKEVWKLLDLFEVKELVFGIQVCDDVVYRLMGTFKLFGLSFALEASYENENKSWEIAGYTLEDSEISLTSFISELTGSTVTMPDFTLSNLRLYGDTQSSEYSFSAMVSEAAQLDFKKENAQFYAQVALQENFAFSSLPFVGGVVKELDRVALENICFCYSNGLAPQGQVPKEGLNVSAQLTLPDGDKELIIPIYTPDQKEEMLYREPDEASDGAFRGSVEIHKSIGPFTMEKLLFSYEKEKIELGLSAAFLTGGLSLSLDELVFHCDTKKDELTASLAGLSLSFSSGSFSVEGGFARKDAGKESYEGSLRVQAGIYGLMLFGAYAAKPYPSAFLFGMLKGRIGGPPCFFITGIAAGFGYARSLVVPSIEKLEDFSLMAAVTGKISEDTVIQNADKDFPAKPEANWIVAGITANSFQMVDLAVLAAVVLDGGFRLDLLGRADIAVPKGAQDPIAKVGLLIKITIDPQSGLIPVDGMLSSDSYVISKDCHISGGFAFYLWYGGEHAGDFVISLGGYANKYNKPAHYPAPERLKLSWKLSDELSVDGSLYFALTPSCVMAGGDLQMVFQWKRVYAWFHAYVDIMIGWKPYSYALDIGISLGVKVDLALFKVKVELGCDLSIWGPEFSGIAKIKLWVISFTIKFGSGIKKDDPISVSEFRTSFLPPLERKNRAVDKGDSEQYGGVSISFAEGVIGELGQGGSQQEGSGTKVVSGQILRLVIKSQIPLVSFTFNDEEINAPSLDESQNIYLRPCRQEAAPKLIVTLKRKDDVPMQSELIVQTIAEEVPAALWEKAGGNAKETRTSYTGLSVSVDKGSAYRRLSCELEGREEDKEYTLKPPAQLSSKSYDQSKAYEILDDINSGDVSKKRDDFLKELQGDWTQSVDLSEFDARNLFDVHPILVETGGKCHG